MAFLTLALSSGGFPASQAWSSAADPLDGYEIAFDPSREAVVFSCRPSARCGTLRFIPIRPGAYFLPASLVRSACNNAALMREAARQPGELNLVIERAGLQAGICSPDEMNAADWKRP